jgi:hypothetical protein
MMKVAKYMEKKIIFCKNNDGQRSHPKGGKTKRQKEQVGKGSPQRQKIPMMKRNQKVT